MIKLIWETIQALEWDSVEDKYVLIEVEKSRYQLKPRYGLGSLTVEMLEDGSHGACQCAPWNKQGHKRGIPCEHMMWVKKYVLRLPKRGRDNVA